MCSCCLPTWCPSLIQPVLRMGTCFPLPALWLCIPAGFFPAHTSPPTAAVPYRHQVSESKQRCWKRVLRKAGSILSLIAVKIQWCLFLPACPMCLTSHPLETLPAMTNPIRVSKLAACRCWFQRS